MLTGLLAKAAGALRDSVMFKNRDPRFYTDIIYNGSPAQGWANDKANMLFRLEQPLQNC